MLALGVIAFVYLSASTPEVWEMDIDPPTLQVNVNADAIRGMNSGTTCLGATDIYRRFGGQPRKNQCTLAFETSDSRGYYAYCDEHNSYLVQVDLDTCRIQELAMFRGRRLTGTAVIDNARKTVLFSHLGGMYAFRNGATVPAASFPGAAAFSKHEYYADGRHVYLLNTVFAHPVLHRIDMDDLRETRVRFQDVMVIDYAGGKLLLRGQKNARAFGLYDVRKRQVVHRWQSPANARAHFLGDGWVAFWTKPAGGKPGDWILANAATGETVYHGKWRGKRPPSVAWKGRVLYAGKKKLLVADKARPVPSPLLKLEQRKAG